MKSSVGATGGGPSFVLAISLPGMVGMGPTVGSVPEGDRARGAAGMPGSGAASVGVTFERGKAAGSRAETGGVGGRDEAGDALDVEAASIIPGELPPALGAPSDPGGAVGTRIAGSTVPGAGVTLEPGLTARISDSLIRPAPANGPDDSRRAAELSSGSNSSRETSRQ